MTGRPVVALSQRVDRYPDRNEIRDAVDQALVRWLAELGFTAAPVPNVLGERGLQAWLATFQPDAVVLSGGNDIGTEPERDATETALIEWAQAGDRPVLGICRGMQMIAVASGGALKTVQGHVRTRHALASPYGMVNSYHDQTLDGLPDGFESLAQSEDGEIEAIRHQTRRVLGWMWHPEREPEFDPGHIQMARAFLGAG